MCYLVFQLFSHKEFYDDHHSSDFVKKYSADVSQRMRFYQRKPKNKKSNEGIATSDPNPASSSPPVLEAALTKEEEKEEEEKPDMSGKVAIGLLIVVTVVCQQPAVVIC